MQAKPHIYYILIILYPYNYCNWQILQSQNLFSKNNYLNNMGRAKLSCDSKNYAWTTLSVYVIKLDQYIGLFLCWGGIQYIKRPMYWSIIKYHHITHPKTTVSQCSKLNADIPCIWICLKCHTACCMDRLSQSGKQIQSMFIEN